MDTTLAWLATFNFWAIGALPFAFFRRDGALNAKWWLTAGPLFISPLFVAVVALGGIELSYTAYLGPAQSALGAFFCCASIFLLGSTLGTHRGRLALWHQQNDAPERIVTEGSYARIRHPFYSAFLLAQAGVVCWLIHPVTVGAFLWSLIALQVTAAGEEKRLLGSQFGAQYRDYLARSGRFLPRLSSVPPLSSQTDTAS